MICPNCGKDQSVVEVTIDSIRDLYNFITKSLPPVGECWNCGHWLFEKEE